MEHLDSALSQCLKLAAMVVVDGLAWLGPSIENFSARDPLGLNGTNTGVVSAIALVALGQRMTVLAHMTPQANIALSSLSQDHLVFLCVSDTLAVVGIVPLTTVLECLGWSLSSRWILLGYTCPCFVSSWWTLLGYPYLCFVVGHSQLVLLPRPHAPKP